MLKTCLRNFFLLGDVLDRREYTGLSLMYTKYTKGTPLHYSEYTGLSLKWIFGLFFMITTTQIVTTLIVKIFTSKAFARRENYLKKFLHLLLSLNLASPFEDWDMGRFTVSEYRERQKLTNIEMAWSLSVNIIFSPAMMVPLWYTGWKHFYKSLNFFCSL